MARIGVGLTTRNRPEIFERTIKEWRARLPRGAVLVVVDDASETPADLTLADASHRFKTNVGVAVAKNRCLELLVDAGCDELFLADDDTWPEVDGWWKPYITSPEPHLMYGFEHGPAHWRCKPTPTGDLVSWNRPRGCLLYVRADVLPIVGGMHAAFGKHGAEHGNWSMRIHAAGLTTHPYADVAGPPRFHCADQDEAGISSVDFAANDGWKHVDAARLPTYAEYRTQAVPVLVPRRADHGHRDRLWRFLQAEFWGPLGYRVVEGHHVEGPFNRSLALNLAANLAGNWDVALVVDSDAWVPSERVAEAIDTARSTGRLVSAFTEVHEVDQPTTETILRNGLTEPPAIGVEKVRTRAIETQSLMLAVPRNAWEQVRGFDEGFIGYGGDDNAFWRACELTTGEPIRLNGPAWHLWHEVQDKSLQATNGLRWQQYRKARNRRDLERLR